MDCSESARWQRARSILTKAVKARLLSRAPSLHNLLVIIDDLSDVDIC